MQTKSGYSKFEILIGIAVLAVVLAAFGPAPLPADVQALVGGERYVEVAVGKINGTAIDATNSTSLALSDTHYTDAVDVSNVDELTVIVRAASIASGGTLTYTLQQGTMVDGTYVWADYQQMSAVDVKQTTDGSSLDYQQQFVSYALAAANVGTKAMVMEGWKPAKFVRLKLATSAHIALVTGVWFVKR